MLFRVKAPLRQRSRAAAIVLLAGLAVVAVTRGILPRITALGSANDAAFNDLLATPADISFDTGCLPIDDPVMPVYECYEYASEMPAGRRVTFTSDQGIRAYASTFLIGTESRVRFTPTHAGVWRSSDGKEIAVTGPRPNYARGFVVAGNDGHWLRSADGRAFVPQFVMYHGSDIKFAVDEFVGRHGFTGLHIPNLRAFMQNPEFFEAIVLETYRAGGTTHFWLWGDQQREQSPDEYPGSVEELYTALGARLGPLPGWTLGFGFDLYEWATQEQIDRFRDAMSLQSSYPHLIGARGAKNRYISVYDDADFASWEWHQPNILDYRDHIREAGGRPAFSEDRFRIRKKTRYPDKDYTLDSTRQGLWFSMIAGGVANIWGNMDDSGYFSAAYANRDAIRFYRDFVDAQFSTDLRPIGEASANSACLSNATKLVCFASRPAAIRIPQQIDIERIESIVATDTIGLNRYELRGDAIASDGLVSVPHASDWALVAEFDAPASR